MDALRLFISQLGFGGGLLFGLPLALIGLALRGLARHQGERLVAAARHRRGLHEIGDAGAVAVSGTARRAADGQWRLTDERTTGCALVELPAGAEVCDGEALLVYGTATRKVGVPTGYRDDAAAWQIDARGDDHFVVRGAAALESQIARSRVHVLVGGLVFALGVLLVAASSAAALRGALLAGF